MSLSWGAYALFTFSPFNYAAHMNDLERGMSNKWSNVCKVSLVSFSHNPWERLINKSAGLLSVATKYSYHQKFELPSKKSSIRYWDNPHWSFYDNYFFLYFYLHKKCNAVWHLGKFHLWIYKDRVKGWEFFPSIFWLLRKSASYKVQESHLHYATSHDFLDVPRYWC